MGAGPSAPSWASAVSRWSLTPARGPRPAGPGVPSTSGESSSAPSSTAPSAPDLLSALQPHCTLEDFTPPGGFSERWGCGQTPACHVSPARPRRVPPGLALCLLQHLPGRVGGPVSLGSAGALCRRQLKVLILLERVSQRVPGGPLAPRSLSSYIGVIQGLPRPRVWGPGPERGQVTCTQGGAGRTPGQPRS